MKFLQIIIFLIIISLSNFVYAVETQQNIVLNGSTKLGDLKINNIKLTDTRNLNIDFNINLDENSLVNLNIVNLENNLDNIEVEKYAIDKNVLKIFLNDNLKLENKYSLTIVTLKGINGEIIESGVDGIKEFFVEKNTKIYSADTLNEDLNSANIVKEDQEEIRLNKVLGGSNLQNDKKIVESVAKNNKDLPTTGPTETLLLLLFSIIAGGLFINLRKKINS